MKSGTIIRWIFIASLLLTLLATYSKLIHSEGADTLLIFAAAMTLIFIATAVYEVTTSKRIDRTEKTMWTLAFIFFSGLTALIYFFIGRKRIVTNS